MLGEYPPELAERDKACDVYLYLDGLHPPYSSLRGILSAKSVNSRFIQPLAGPDN